MQITQHEKQIIEIIRNMQEHGAIEITKKIDHYIIRPLPPRIFIKTEII